MKKRIEEDGVVYTIDATSGNCIDIDVKPGVEEVSFGASFGREYLLGACKKAFPDVRKIVIDYSVYDIDIPNTLFPNVKEVKSNNYYGKYTKKALKKISRLQFLLRAFSLDVPLFSTFCILTSSEKNPQKNKKEEYEWK